MSLSTTTLRVTALETWLAEARGNGDALSGTARATDALLELAPDRFAHRWRVLEVAGALARLECTLLDSDCGLTEIGTVVSPHHPRAVVRVNAGSWAPVRANTQRKRRGAFDTPQRLVRDTISRALDAVDGAAQRALDPASGTGAFLLGLVERGVSHVEGHELDPIAATVACRVVPEAEVFVRDAFSGSAPEARFDLVVGNPPFIPPERQDKKLRSRLRRMMPWLHGRFDLAVPFTALALEHTRPGGVVGLVLPSALLVQPYGRALRRQLLENNRIVSIVPKEKFPGAHIHVNRVFVQCGVEPGPIPPHNVSPADLLSLSSHPLDGWVRPGDVELLKQLREASTMLGEIAEIDTGVVVHGAGHRREDLVSDEHTPGTVPYVDAADLSHGRIRYLRYRPDAMHRPKRPGLFADPKVLVMRIRGDGALRAWVDTQGLYAGHTLNVVRPYGVVSTEHVHAFLTDPAALGLLRLLHGDRLDVYPKALRSLPFPSRWADGDTHVDLAEAWGLSSGELSRLRALGAPN